MHLFKILPLALCFFVITAFTADVTTALSNAETVAQKDPLPSWNDGASKKAIIAFVSNATNSKSSQFIPVEDRIATFDNDGTLWSEQPAYFQLFFAIDRVKAMAKDHPEWKTQQPYKAVLENDMEALKQSGMKGILQIVATTHTGMTVEEFDAVVKSWASTAKHPTKNVPYTDMVFQPMLELLHYLRANQFKTYIVSGGGVNFMRAFLPSIYGIPEEQIIGTRFKTEWTNDGNKPSIKVLPEMDFIDDKEGKPLNIQKIIGKKPVFAAGNSDGDLQMLQWTASNKLNSFMLYVHHTDAEREWAYDRGSHIGGLDKGLDEATKRGWTLVDMKKDWKVIYPRYQ
ncbi:HAD family phosphatase [Mangrovimonas sp. TPBH4]|uniref:HAD family hydrolase n=1 Tax=Mangrovimonas sp. TPBH4 TaxID=1645914 RepID=UPI0006B693D5|nr:HAD family hydrolase [Mangrovimonas sp. TPBH4]